MASGGGSEVESSVGESILSHHDEEEEEEDCSPSAFLRMLDGGAEPRSAAAATRRMPAIVPQWVATTPTSPGDALSPAAADPESSMLRRMRANPLGEEEEAKKKKKKKKQNQAALVTAKKASSLFPLSKAAADLTRKALASDVEETTVMLQLMHQLFDIADANHDGVLDVSEIITIEQKLSHALQVDFDQNAVEKLIAKVDSDADGWCVFCTTTPLHPAPVINVWRLHCSLVTCLSPPLPLYVNQREYERVLCRHNIGTK